MTPVLRPPRPPRRAASLRTRAARRSKAAASPSGSAVDDIARPVRRRVRDTAGERLRIRRPGLWPRPRDAVGRGRARARRRPAPQPCRPPPVARRLAWRTRAGASRDGRADRRRRPRRAIGPRRRNGTESTSSADEEADAERARGRQRRPGEPRKVGPGRAPRAAGTRESGAETATAPTRQHTVTWTRGAPVTAPPAKTCARGKRDDSAPGSWRHAARGRRWSASRDGHNADRRPNESRPSASNRANGAMTLARRARRHPGVDRRRDDVAEPVPEAGIRRVDTGADRRLRGDGQAQQRMRAAAITRSETPHAIPRRSRRRGRPPGETSVIAERLAAADHHGVESQSREEGDCRSSRPCWPAPGPAPRAAERPRPPRRSVASRTGRRTPPTSGNDCSHVGSWTTTGVTSSGARGA